MKGRLDKEDVDAVLSPLGHAADARTEQLTISQIQQLVEALRQAEAEQAATRGLA